ncbi:hypothetical protein PQO03_11370 [Lentisphaera profundi]|uniref:Alginate export domain-containing protein n=1 Tax=Lentisphaera profundi TaxID=1658616 RepID=A0ABY7VSR7_9BACT|nr:hypothetical protein [Lentisphaera profundi]WDE96308.1 hypothetical protein PQO03_11370 [Lentisphaera profundi]
MKFVNYSMAFLCACLSLSTMAEEFSSKPETDVDNFISWLESGESRVALGNFTSVGQAKDNDRLIFNRVDGGKTVGYSSTYIEGNYISPEISKWQFGVGVHAHAKTWDLQDTYDEKYPDSQDIYFTDSFLRYNFTEDLFLQGGRFNVRNIAQRFDPNYGQGLYLHYKNEKFSVDIGAIDKLAYYYNDYVVDYTSADDQSQWGYNDDVDSTIYFAETTIQVTDKIKMNPYAYYQDQYVGWYGLDTTIQFHKTDTYEYGTKVFAYYLDAQEDSENDDEGKGSFNYSINPFYHREKWKFDLGYSKFGDNSKNNSPSWGYRYFTNVLYHDGGLGDIEIIDYNPLYGTKGTDIYFGRVGFHEEKWTLGFTAGLYTPEENDTYHNIWEFQFGGSYNLTEHLNFGGRLVNLTADERGGVSDQDANYFETWINYVF